MIEHKELFEFRYGTALDRQLHQELCRSRKIAFDLQTTYAGFENVEQIYGAVNHFSALSKAQTDARVAYNLSSFCQNACDVGRVAGKVGTIVVGGVFDGCVNFVNHSANTLLHPIDGLIISPLKSAHFLGKALWFSCNNPAAAKEKTLALAE